MADKPQVGFIVACKDFFGFKSDQKLTDFKAEVDQLSPKDKEEIREGLMKHHGYNIKPL
jgi:hypothetical protein